LDIDSVPPQSTTRASPAAIAWVARITARMPEAHIMLTVVAGRSTGTPKPTPTCRAMFIPSPAPSTLPTMTWSIRSGPTSSRAARPAQIARSTAESLAKAPRKRP